MKRSIAMFCALAALCTIGLAACNDSGITPGNTTTTPRNVKDFTHLDISHGFEVVVIRDTAESVTIEAPEGWQSKIRTYVSEGTLHINIEDNIFSGSFSPRKAYVHMKSLASVEASGGSRVSSIDTFSAEAFAMQGSGGSSINLRLTAGAIRCEASGGTSITIAGTARNVTVASCSGSSRVAVTGTADDLTVEECSGGSEVHAFDLPTGTAAVDASGGSSVDVRAANELNADASGGSTVRYKGHPHITQHLSGGSRLVDAN